ncbi:neogenin isoform X2 [Patella vulgata]|uniref:neogenin isoform X2 n=1 Tax=Patella vulgata TaxID=6465 RepID=UPI0021800BEA|nr:neogenin isoform X2 [Patella vulgata]
MDLHIYQLFIVCLILLCVDGSRLSKPRRLKTKVISPTAIKVQWKDPNNHKLVSNLIYKVRYSKTRKGKVYKTINTKDKSIVIEELKPNTTYQFSVRAQEGKGRDRVSSWSLTALNKTLKQVSGTASKLKAVPLTSTSILLTWKLPPQRNRTSGFYVLWSEVDEDARESRVAVSKQSNSSLFRDLIPDCLYSFRVVTLKANGVEKSTHKIYARPYQARPAQAPRNVSFALLENSVLQVTWLPPPVRQRHGTILSYKLQYTRKGARRGDICTITSSDKPRIYNLTELRRGETYRIRIAARTVNGTGPYSKWAPIDIPLKWKGSRRKSSKKNQADQKQKTIPIPTTTTARSPNDGYPEMPEGLNATALSSTSIKLSWNIPSSPACCPIVAYTIHVTNLDNLKDEKELVTGPNTVEIIEDLDPSTYYGFNVTAFNTQGVSHDSEEIIQKTKEPVPPRIVKINHSDSVEGGIVNITCIATGDPLPWVSWHSTNSTAFAQTHSEIKSFNNRQPEKGTNEMTVMFQDVSTRQAGKYMCLAKNIAGSVNSTLDLQVNVPVRFTKIEGGIAMIESSVNLTCAASGVPLPSITWLTPDGLEAYTDERATIFEWIERESEYEHVGTLEVLYNVLRLEDIVMADGGNYTCLAQNDVNFSRRKAELQIEVPPPPPVLNLQVFPVSPSVVLVSWTRPEYNFTITSYKVIYRKKESGVEESIDTMEQSCHISDLTADKLYKIKVLAFNKGHGDPSRIEIRTLRNKNLQPANVSAVALNTSIIRLDWEAPYGIDRVYIKGYFIYYRKENGSNEEKLYTHGSRNKQFLIGLGKQDIYFLRIATLMTWGDEFPSQWIKIKKSAQELLPPPEPTNVFITPASEKVRITWQSPVGKGQGLKDLKGYRIVYGPKDDTTAKIKKIRVSKFATRHTITSLLPGTAYIISLRSFNDYGESSPIYLRTTTKATRPGPVQSASATPLSSTTIFVSWITPTKGQATDYHVRYWRRFKNDKQSQWMKAPQTNITVKELRKFREYKFEIIPYHEGEIGESTVLFARTKSDVPDAPPRKIKMKAINATAMRIRWDVPPKALQNGRITGYKLVFKRFKSNRPLATFTVDGNRKNYTFYGLESSMQYKARVAAMTIRGTGPYSKWHSGKTLEVEKLPPERPASLTLLSTERSIHISWTLPRYTGASIDGYILGYGRYIPEVNRQILPSTSLSHDIKQLRENTEYIISIRAFNKYGESSATYDFIKTKEVPLKLEPPEMIKAITLSSTSIGIYWIDPALNKFRRRDSRQYTLRYSSESDTDYTYRNVSKPPVILDNLQVHTKYEFAIRVIRGTDFSKWSLPVSNTTFVEPPKSVPIKLGVTATEEPSKLTVSWKPVEVPEQLTNQDHSQSSPYDVVISQHGISHNTVDMTWSKPRQPDGKLTGYHISYTSSKGDDLINWRRIETTNTMVTVTQLQENTTYYFKVQALYTTHAGYFSDMVNFTTKTERLDPRLQGVPRVSVITNTTDQNEPTSKRLYTKDSLSIKTTVLPVYEELLPPVNITLTSTNSSITVIWTQPRHTNHITKYIIQYGTTDSQQIQTEEVEKLEATELSVILSNLEATTTYTIIIQSEGYNAVSDSVSKTISTKD